MALIVQKFGGSSVKDAEHLRNVADIVTGTYKNGNDVVVVVSAQGDTTDDLIDKAKEINRNPSKREMDQLLTAFTRQTRAKFRRRGSLTSSPTTRCWSLRRWARRC